MKNKTKESESKVKLYKIADKLNGAITYDWTKKINRETENNVALIKVAPLFMNELQKIDASIVSCRAFLKDYCKLKQIAWNDDFLNYSLVKEVEEKPMLQAQPKAVAVADALNPKIAQLNAWLGQCAVSGHNPNSEQLLAIIEKLEEPDREAVIRHFLPDTWKERYGVKLDIPVFQFV